MIGTPMEQAAQALQRAAAETGQPVPQLRAYTLAQAAVLAARRAEKHQTTARRAVAPKLTPRELQVVRLAARGLPNKEIAAELFLTEDSVKTHMSRAFKRLHARDRAHAVGLAMYFGLVTEDDVDPMAGKWAS